MTERAGLGDVEDAMELFGEKIFGANIEPEAHSNTNVSSSENEPVLEGTGSRKISRSQQVNKESFQ